VPRPRFYKLSEEKRARILSVARTEFAESGLEGASYNRIIEKAGLSKGAMYYYFDDKTDLYAAVVDDVQREMMAEVDPLIPAPDGDFWSGLEAMFRRSIQFAVARPELASLMRSLRDVRHVREGAVAEMYQKSRELTQQLIERGQATGDVRTDLPQSLLVSVAFAIGEAGDFWLIDQFGEFAFEGDVEKTVQLFLRLWRSMLMPPKEE
jgi:AcrR family transcriptional regulator